MIINKTIKTKTIKTCKVLDEDYVELLIYSDTLESLDVLPVVGKVFTTVYFFGKTLKTLPTKTKSECGAAFYIMDYQPNLKVEKNPTRDDTNILQICLHWKQFLKQHIKINKSNTFLGVNTKCELPESIHNKKRSHSYFNNSVEYKRMLIDEVMRVDEGELFFDEC